MRLAVVACLLIAAPAGAQVAYRCQVGAKVTLQGHPCPASAKQTVRPYERTPSDPYAQQRSQAVEAEMDRRNVQRAAYASGSGPVFNRTYYNGELVSTSPDPQVARCEIAQRERAATLERVGLRRNFNLLRNLDETVRRACSR